MTTVTDGTAAAAGATGACAVSGTTAAASALRAAAGRTLLVMTTSEETTKEWRLGKLCTSREVGGGGVARVTREGARPAHLRRSMGDTEASVPAVGLRCSDGDGHATGIDEPNMVGGAQRGQQPARRGADHCRIPRLEHVGVLTVEAQIEHGDARPRGGLRGERGGGEHAGQVQDGT